jgi:gas vesicle protein
MKITYYIDGFLTGMVIGLLFAPASGYETRKKLLHRYNDLKRSVNDAYKDSKEEVSEELAMLTNREKTDVKERVQDLKDDV